MIMANSVLEDVPSPKIHKEFLRLFWGGVFFFSTGCKNPAYNVG